MVSKIESGASRAASLRALLAVLLGTVAITYAPQADASDVYVGGSGPSQPIAVALTGPCQNEVVAPLGSPVTTWTPTGTANWTTAADWSNGLPNSTAGLAEIPAGTVQVNSAVSANFLNVCTGTLDLQAGGSLTATDVQVGGTLVLSASTGAINGGIVINGGTLRSAVSGTLANSIDFGNYSPSTLAVATGQTLTLTAGFEPFYFYQQVVFGSATDTGTIVITPSAFIGTIYGPPAGSMEIAGGTVMAGNSFLGAFDAAITTIDAGATLNFNDQQPTGGDRIYNLQGAGNVVTGTSSAIVLQLAQGNFSGTIAGGGSLVVQPVCLPNPYAGGTWCSTGVVVLSGNNTYTGSTTVTSGTLRVTGSIAASSGVTVNAGSTFGGTGTVPTTKILAGATIAPGGGTMHISGGLTIANGAAYVVDVSSSAADEIVVSGAANVAGALTISASSQPAAGTKLTILSGSGGVNGKFTPLNIGGLGMVAPTLAYDADDVYLDYGLVTLTPQLPTNATTNEKNLAAGIDKAILAGETLPSGIQALGSASSSALSAGVSQLSGEVGADLPQIGAQTLNPFLSVLLDQTDNLDVGLRSNGATGLEAGLVAGPPHFGASGNYTPQSRAQFGGNASGPIGFWSSGFGGHSNIDGDASGAGTHSVSANAAGAAAGTDIRIAPDFLIGAAAAGDRTTFSTEVGDGSSDDWQFGIYGTKRFGARTYLSVAGAYALQDIRTNRTVTTSSTDVLTASVKAHDYGGRVESGYRFIASGWNLTPYIAAEAQHFEAPAYSETALSGSSPYALDYAANNVTNAQAELGASADETLKLSRHTDLYLYGRVAWSHAFEREASAQATFQSLPDSEFLVRGVTPGSDAALLTFEAELAGRNGLSIGLKFNGSVSQSSTSYFGMAGLDYTW
jgi:autotransporter-associated beta strand protein